MLKSPVQKGKVFQFPNITRRTEFISNPLIKLKSNTGCNCVQSPAIGYGGNPRPISLLRPNQPENVDIFQKEHDTENYQQLTHLI